jgi:hypothetical protein
VLADPQASLDALPPGTDLVPPPKEESPEGTITYCPICGGSHTGHNFCEDRFEKEVGGVNNNGTNDDSDVKDVEFGDPHLMDYFAVCGTACEFAHPNPLQMEKSMTYRLIYTHPNQPCSDWAEDVTSLLDCVEQRPDWVQKIHVEDEKGNAMIREGWAAPLGRPVYRLEPNGVLVRLILVLNANGKPMLVDEAEGYRYNGNDNEGLAVFGFPPNATAEEINNLLDPLVSYYDGGQQFLIRKSEADYLERFDEFEAAADTADALEKLNANKPNNLRDSEPSGRILKQK